MEAVRSLCNKGVLLEKGEMKHSGTTEDVILEYFKGLSTDQRKHYKPSLPIAGNGMELIECSVSADSNAPAIVNGQSLQINFSIANAVKKKFSLYLFVFRDESLAFISSDLHDPCSDKLSPDQDAFEASFVIPPYLLNPGHCRIGLMIADYNGNTEQFFNKMDLLNFQVEDDGVRRGNRYNLGWSGAVSPLLKIFPK
jgi:lipopolysaccharide transport system ATP-binding protein